MDTLAYPLSNRGDSPLSGVRHLFGALSTPVFYWLLLFPALLHSMLTASSVCAENWVTSPVTLPESTEIPPFAADIAGDGRDELLFLAEGGRLLAIHDVGNSGQHVSQVGTRPLQPANLNPYRLPGGPSAKDRIAWISGGTLIEWTVANSEQPISRSFTLPPGVDFSPGGVGWRCGGPLQSLMMGTTPGTDGCIGVGCFEPIVDGSLPARSAALLCPPLTTFVALDLEGNGIDSLLLTQPTMSSWLAASPPTTRVWASFPPRVQWKKRFVGDFDGNGKEDLLLHGSPLRVTYIAHTFERYSLETPVEWPFTPEVDANSITVGDFDGDGRSDLVGLKPTRREIVLALSRDAPKPPSSRPTHGAITDFGAVPNQPSVCIGYNPFVGQWAGTKWGAQTGFCPNGFAYYGATEGLIPGAEHNTVIASCCPLPRRDILLEEHVFAAVECPDGYVITGSEPLNKSEASKVRCTKINAAKYQLGPLKPGRYWGNGLSSRGQLEQLQLADLPVAIRSGISRTDYSSWSIDGCVGTPPGALLVKKGAKHCQESGYRELLENGVPVKMFPDCREIENVFDPTSGCW